VRWRASAHGAHCGGHARWRTEAHSGEHATADTQRRTHTAADAQRRTHIRRHTHRHAQWIDPNDGAIQ